MAISHRRVRGPQGVPLSLAGALAPLAPRWLRRWMQTTTRCIVGCKPAGFQLTLPAHCINREDKQTLRKSGYGYILDMVTTYIRPPRKSQSRGAFHSMRRVQAAPRSRSLLQLLDIMKHVAHIKHTAIRSYAKRL